MNISLKFEILTFSAASETHFWRVFPCCGGGGANSTFVGQTTLVLNPSCMQSLEELSLREGKVPGHCSTKSFE